MGFKEKHDVVTGIILFIHLFICLLTCLFVHSFAYFTVHLLQNLPINMAISNFLNTIVNVQSKNPQRSERFFLYESVTLELFFSFDSIPKNYF